MITDHTPWLTEHAWPSVGACLWPRGRGQTPHYLLALASSPAPPLFVFVFLFLFLLEFLFHVVARIAKRFVAFVHEDVLKLYAVWSLSS